MHAECEEVANEWNDRCDDDGRSKTAFLESLDRLSADLTMSNMLEGNAPEPDIVVSQDENHKVLATVPDVQLGFDAAAAECGTAFDAARNAFTNTIFAWRNSPAIFENLQKADTRHQLSEECGRAAKLHKIAEVCESLLGAEDEVVEKFAHNHKCLKLVALSVGVLLDALHEAGMLGAQMREWQLEMLIDAVHCFMLIANNELTEYPQHTARDEQCERNSANCLTWPWFVELPVFLKPTGSGKSFAGMIAAFFSAVRTDGSTFKLLSPRSASIIWCVPTRALVDDIYLKLEKVVATSSFKILTPRNLSNIPKSYITRGLGATSPDIKNKMLAVMTYEYARSCLQNAPVNDFGDAESLRLPLVLTCRAVIIDEAHYICKTDDRAKTLDNIINACGALKIPLVLLTATPPDAFTDFVVEAFNISKSLLVADDVKRSHIIRQATIAVPDDNMCKDRATLSGVCYNGHKELITRIDKLIAYKCYTQTFCNASNDRSMYFIQSVKSCQLIACYMVGMHLAHLSNAKPNNVAKLMNELSAEYMQVLKNFEDGYALLDVKRDEMLSAMLQGLADVSSQQCAFSAHISKLNAAIGDNEMFATFLCFKYKIMPFFANFAKTKDAMAVISAALFKKGDYRIVVTTSATLEGVTIRDVDNLYITPFGFQLITQTQYVQLCGRVGRNKAGYVETYYQREIDKERGVAIPKKMKCVQQQQVEELKNSRVVETDELIDRILFNINLLELLKTSAYFVKCVDRINDAKISNVYFRGKVAPRLTSYYMAVSTPAEVYEAEVGCHEMPYEIYNNYLSSFTSQRYTTFFELYNDITFEAVSPQLTLSAITFIIQLSRIAEEMHVRLTSAEGSIHTLFYIPLLAKYTYAFNPAKSDTKSVTGQLIDRASSLGLTMCNAGDTCFELASAVVERMMPDVRYDKNLATKIDMGVLAFVVSLIVNPHIWLAASDGAKFIDALSVVSAYTNVLLSINRSKDAPFVPYEALEGVQKLKIMMLSLFTRIRDIVSATIASATLQSMATRTVDQHITFPLHTTNQRIELGISYRSYIFAAMGCQHAERTTKTGSAEEVAIFKNFVNSIPSNVFKL